MENNNFLNMAYIEDFVGAVGVEVAKAPAQIVAGVIVASIISVAATAGKSVYKNMFKTGSPTFKL